MSNEENVPLKEILEGALFAAGEPLSVDRMVALFDVQERPDKKMIRESLKEIVEAYRDHGIELRELASGFQFQVKANLVPWVKRLWEERPPRYSRALLETMALIAYRQPITRGEIEEVRGVAVSTPMIRTLLDRDWVKVVGERNVPGKPSLYGTTKEFLDYFGLKSLSDLPLLADITDLDKAGEALQESIQENIQENIQEDMAEETIDENVNESSDEPVGEGL